MEIFRRVTKEVRPKASHRTFRLSPFRSLQPNRSAAGRMRCRKTQVFLGNDAGRALPSPFPYSFFPRVQKLNSQVTQQPRENCPAPAEPPGLPSTEPIPRKSAWGTFSGLLPRPLLAESIFRWLGAARVRNALRPIH